MAKQLGTGLRYNEGKLRYDLVNPLAHKGMVEVLTFGARKYSDHNWENGMVWTKIIQSLKRHLACIELGEDYDEETGLLHADHVQCNAHFLAAYYRIFPQGDDRYLKYRPKSRIGLDIDDVLANWVETWTQLWFMSVPDDWNFDYFLQTKFKQMKDDGTLDEFYENLPMKTLPTDLPFRPDCYITHRPVSKTVTECWIQENGYPTVPVFQVENREEKLKIAQERKLDIFVDDNIDTFNMMNQNGICCFLFDALHNQKYDVGYRRIKSLKEIFV